VLKLNRVIDYGILIVTHLIREEDRGKGISSAKEIAAANHLSLPMVSKILKTLVRSGMIVSVRGLHGGYALVPEIREMTLGGLIRAVDGPVRLTDCSPRSATAAIECDLHTLCSLRGTMLRLNSVVESAFDNISLVELAGPAAPAFRIGSLPALPFRSPAPAQRPQ